MLNTMLKTGILGRGNVANCRAVRAILETLSVILNIFMFMTVISKITNRLIKASFFRKIKIFNSPHLVICLLKKNVFSLIITEAESEPSRNLVLTRSILVDMFPKNCTRKEVSIFH